MSQYKQFAKSTAIIAIGSIFSRTIVFLMLPIYTHVLNKAQFGLVDILQISMYFLGILVNFQLGEALFRFLSKYGEDLDLRIKVSSTAFAVTLALSALFLCLSPLLGLLSEFKAYSFLFALSTVALVFLELIKSFARGTNQLKPFAICDILYTFVLCVLSVVFLTIFKWGVHGFLYALLTAQLIAILFLTLQTRVHEYLNIKAVNIPEAQKLLAYSIPLIPSALSVQAMSYISRYIIIAQLGLGAAGLFAVSAKISTLFNVVSQIIGQSWQISACQQFDDPTQSPEQKTVFFSNIFSYTAAFYILLTSGLLLGLKWMIGCFVDPKFYIAWMYSPALLVGMLFSGLSSFFSASFVAAQQTRWMFYLNLLGALFCAAINWVLIPHIGLQGAAIAQMSTSGLMLILMMFQSRQYIRVQLSVKTLWLFGLLVLQIWGLYKVPSNAVRESFFHWANMIQLLAFTLILASNTTVIVKVLKSLWKPLTKVLG